MSKYKLVGAMVMGGSYAFGMDNHPSDDSIFYLNNYYAQRTEKIIINSSKNNIQSRTLQEDAAQVNQHQQILECITHGVYQWIKQIIE